MKNELIKKEWFNSRNGCKKRVRGGWALLEALHAPYGMRLAEYKEIVLSKKSWSERAKSVKWLGNDVKRLS